MDWVCGPIWLLGTKAESALMQDRWVRKDVVAKGDPNDGAEVRGEDVQ
jgi:hypothetical protein